MGELLDERTNSVRIDRSGHGRMGGGRVGIGTAVGTVGLGCCPGWVGLFVPLRRAVLSGRGSI
jgi:hypothetical protein